MSLLELEEPRELKQMIKNLNTVLGTGTSGARGRGKGLLVYNKLPQYIWSSWSKELKKLGIEWGEFLSVISKHSDLIVEWAVEEKISWKEYLTKLREVLLTYSKTKTGRRVSLDTFTKKST